MKTPLKLGLMLVLLLSACDAKEQQVTATFTNDYLINLKKEATAYKIQAYDNGEVPFKSLVKISGKITTTDAKNDQKINKNDRFILTSDDYQFHLINNSQTIPKLTDTVTIYGEYNGLTSAAIIEIDH